jgi:RNA polymerase sigma-70 factor (ECF subfamily)
MSPVLPSIEINSEELSFSDEQVRIPSLVMDFQNLSSQKLLDHCFLTNDQMKLEFHCSPWISRIFHSRNYWIIAFSQMTRWDGTNQNLSSQKLVDHCLLTNDQVELKFHRLAMDFRNLSLKKLLEYCLLTDDQVGWDEFVERIKPTIGGVVYNTLNHSGWCDPDAIQDLIQNTLLKLFAKNKKALREFVPKHKDYEISFYGYVKKITRHVVLDHLRKTQREDPLEEAMEFAARGAFSDRAPLNHVLLLEVEQRLEKLTADQMEKDIFWFYFKYGFTAKEIAEMPEIKLNTEIKSNIRRVEAILYRLVRQLRRGFGRGASE